MWNATVALQWSFRTIRNLKRNIPKSWTHYFPLKFLLQFQKLLSDWHNSFKFLKRISCSMVEANSIHSDPVFKSWWMQHNSDIVTNYSGWLKCHSNNRCHVFKMLRMYGVLSAWTGGFGEIPPGALDYLDHVSHHLCWNWPYVSIINTHQI